MRKKKIHLEDMSEEELLAMALQYEERCSVAMHADVSGASGLQQYAERLNP